MEITDDAHMCDRLPYAIFVFQLLVTYSPSHSRKSVWIQMIRYELIIQITLNLLVTN